jgi:hypothetical protein
MSFVGLGGGSRFPVPKAKFPAAKRIVESAVVEKLRKSDRDVFVKVPVKTGFKMLEMYCQKIHKDPVSPNS